MLTGYDKQATGNREPANEMNKEDPTQGILVWLQPFTVKVEIFRHFVRLSLNSLTSSQFGRIDFVVCSENSTVESSMK